MKHWIMQNILQLISALLVITFGYANFTKDIQANAQGVSENKKNIEKLEEKLDKAILLLERIDERTSHGR